MAKGIMGQLLWQSSSIWSASRGQYRGDPQQQACGMISMAELRNAFMVPDKARAAIMTVTCYLHADISASTI